MNRLKKEVKARDDPYQGILVLCKQCKHVSIQAYDQDAVYTCPSCGSNMKEVKV